MRSTDSFCLVRRWVVGGIALLVLMACGNSGTGSLPSTPTPQAIAVTPIHAQAQIVVDTANLRAGAGLTYQQIGRLSKDTLVSVSGVSSDGNWYQVSAVDPQGASIQGWVAADFITYITPAPSSIDLATAMPTPTGVASATAGQAAPAAAAPAQRAAPLADPLLPPDTPMPTGTVVLPLSELELMPTPTIISPDIPSATETTLVELIFMTPTPTDTLVPVETPPPTTTTTPTMVAPETPTDTLVPAEIPPMTTTATEDVPTATADEPIEPTPTDTVIPPATPTDTAPAVVPSVVTPVEATP